MWVFGKLKCSPGMDLRDLRSLVIIITCDLQLSFHLCLHLGRWGLQFIVMCELSRSDTHSDHPPEVIIVNTFLCVRLLWITACVHVVCDYCSVTLEAVCRMSAKNVGTFFSRDSSISTYNNTRLPSLVVAAAFPPFIPQYLWHQTSHSHHSKLLASFLFLITAALTIKTSPCFRLQAPECFPEVSTVSANVALFNFMVGFFIGFVAVCVLLIKTSKCFTVHWSFTLPAGARAVSPVSEGSDGGQCCTPQVHRNPLDYITALILTNGISWWGILTFDGD